MEVSEIMHPNVYCAVGDMTVRDLYMALLANEIAGAPVLDANDYLIGVVSVTDVARCVAGESNQDCMDYYSRSGGNNRGIEPTKIAKKLKVSDIMTQRIHQVSLDTSLEETLDLILDEDIHRVIVTHRGHVVGIVTSGDLLRAFREMLRDDLED
jgi:CBS domain-containing protein